MTARRLAPIAGAFVLILGALAVRFRRELAQAWRETR